MVLSDGYRKTQIALHHACFVKDARPNTSVFWVQANNIEQLYESYASIAQKCNIPGSSNIGFNPLDLVPWWLTKKAKSPWLMVVDGAGDMESLFQTDQGKRMAGLSNADDVKQHDMAAYIPKCSHGAILFTTTNPESNLFVGASMIEVDKLNTDEASELIRNDLYYLDYQEEDVDLLSFRLDNLPLAITLATSYIRTNSITIKGYIWLLRGVGPTVVDLRDSLDATDPKEPKIPPEVTGPCLVLLQQLEREDGTTSELLRHASLFYHQGILPAFLNQYPTAGPQDPMSTKASLSKLKMSSALLQRNDDILEMHRLVQLVTQKLLLRKGGMVRAAEEAMLAFWWSYPYGQPIEHSTLATYLLNAFSIFRCYEKFSWIRNAPQLAVMQSLMVYSESRGRWKDIAMQYAEEIVHSVEKLGEEHPETLDIMSKLSFIYMHQHRWEDAEMLQSYLLGVQSEVLGDDALTIEMARKSRRLIASRRKLEEEMTSPLGKHSVTDVPSSIRPTQPPWTGFPWAALKQDILASRKENSKDKDT